MQILNSCEVVTLVVTLSVRDSAKLELLLSPELFALKVLRVFSR